jgi:ATP-binding cassette, subfamily F, member 3
MDKLNGEKTRLDTFVADAASYEPAMKTQLTDSIRRQADVNGQLEVLEAQWLEAHEELEQIGGA